MRFVIMVAVICFALLSTISACVAEPAPGATKHKGGVTLLGSLEEWKYPGSKMPEGATMTGNGPYPPMQFVIGRTVMTTPDSMEKVVDFYSNKFKSVPDPSAESGKGTKLGDAQSVIVQDDSKGRPVGVRVIMVIREKTSTTLVISRAEGEKQTHIAWSHFIRLGEER